MPRESTCAEARNEKLTTHHWPESTRCINDSCSDPVFTDVVPVRNAVDATKDKPAISTPILVGIVVGAVVGIAIAIACLFFVIKALKAGTAATTALHATQAGQQAHNFDPHNQDPQDDHKFDPKVQEFAVLMLGLDGAGKSMFVGKAQSVLNFTKFKPGNVKPNPVKKGIKDVKIAYLNAIMTFQDQSGEFESSVSAECRTDPFVRSQVLSSVVQRGSRTLTTITLYASLSIRPTSSASTRPTPLFVSSHSRFSASASADLLAINRTRPRFSLDDWSSSSRPRQQARFAQRRTIRASSRPLQLAPIAATYRLGLGCHGHLGDARRWSHGCCQLAVHLVPVVSCSGRAWRTEANSRRRTDPRRRFNLQPL